MTLFLTIFFGAIMFGVLVLVHELGHYLAARWCGVQPKEFAIGVGPRLTSFTRDGTTFMIGALPLGGYVLMAENDDDAGERISLPSARIWKRAVIAVMGPVFSFVFPVLLYLLVGLGSSATPASIVGQVAEDGPAAAAGMHPGDDIQEVNGAEVRYFHDLEREISSSSGEIDVLVLRDDKEVALQITPQTASDGVPRIGISLTPEGEDATIPMREFPAAERVPWAFEYAVTQPFVVSGRILSVLSGFATGESSSKELGGPIMIFDVSRRASEQGWQAFLLVMAIISINLALLNMLPIPILDGGRLVLLAIEGIQRRPLSLRTQQIAGTVGIAMVIGLILLASMNDIERLFES